MLIGAEGDGGRAGENVAHVVKENAADIVADQRKAQFGLVRQQRRSSQREPRNAVAGTGLEIGEAAQRIGAPE